MSAKTSKTVEKVADATNRGLTILDKIIDGVFHLDSRRIERIGKAEREKRIKDAIANAEIEKYELLQRANMRFIQEQINKQINLENTLSKARDNLRNKDIADQDVDIDFMRRFSSVAQDVSEEAIQNLIANILSGKITNQNAYSVRLLDFIHNCSKHDLEVCKKFFAISSPIGLFSMDKIDTFHRYQFGKYDISFEEYNLLLDYNLVSSINTTYYNSSQTFVIDFPNKSIIGSKSTLPISDRFSISKLSALGAELYRVLQNVSSNTKQDQYFSDLSNYFRAHGYNVQYINHSKADQNT